MFSHVFIQETVIDCLSDCHSSVSKESAYNAEDPNLFP